MIKLRLTSLAIVLAFGILVPLAAAQTAPPQSGSPETSPSQGAPSTSPLSAQTKSALKLAGLVTFVANSCPALKPDYQRFQTAINALGVTEADLNRTEMRGRYLGYAARYHDDIKTSCQRAEKEFGPHGTTLPDIFQPQPTNVVPPKQP